MKCQVSFILIEDYQAYLDMLRRHTLRNILITAFWAMNFLVEAQTPVIDSLKKRIDSHLKDTTQINLLNDLALEVNRQLKNEALMYTNTALNLAQKIKYKRGIADAYSNLGYYHRYNLLNAKLAIYYYDTASVLHLECGMMNKYATDLIQMGGAYEGEGSLQAALNLYTKAATVLEGNINYNNSGLGYEMIGHIYSEKGNYELAEKYYLLAIEKYKVNDRFPLISQVHLSLGNTYLMTKEPQKALDHARESYRLSIRHNLSYGLIISNCIAAEAFILQKNYDSARVFINIAKSLNQSSQVERLYNVHISYAAGLLSYETHRWKEAEQFLLQVVNSQHPKFFTGMRLEANKLLASLYEETGKANDALFYYKKYTSLNDSVQQSRSKIIIEDIEAKHRAEKQTSENEMLKMKLEQESILNHVQLLIMALGLITILGALIIIYTLSRSRRQIRKKNKLLNNQNNEIQAQNEEIKSQQEEIMIQSEQLTLKNEFLRAQNQQLEDLNREKDALVGVVAHDLRTPLNQSKGFAEILKSTGLGTDQLNLVNMITRVNDDGLHLIRDLLQLTSIDYENLQGETLILDQFIHESIEKTFRPIAANKGIELHVAVEQHLAIVTDRLCLKRVLENLVSNALKFSNPNSSVYLFVLSSNESVYISVDGHGPGISESDQKKMFRKFQKLSARPTSGESSTGLGLAIVKGLIEKLGGELKVTSQVGKGSSFIIRLNKTLPVKENKYLDMGHQREG